MSAQGAIIVCTFNRSMLLAGLLEDLELCLEDEREIRVVIVDNASNDGTADLVNRFCQRPRFTSVLEVRQGKTHALNAGLEDCADADYVIFCDDDVRLAPGWLNSFRAAIASHSECGWFGGRVLPDFQGAAPRWLRAETRPAFRGYFIEYDLGEESRAYAAGDPLPLGAAMAVRREVIDAIGEFRTDLGPRGRARGMGDDTEYIQRAIDAGFSGWYVADAVCFHHVHPDRYRLAEYYRYGFAKGLNQQRWGVLPGEFSRAGRVWGDGMKALVQAARGRGDRMRLCLINAGIAAGAREARREAGGSSS